MSQKDDLNYNAFCLFRAKDHFKVKEVPCSAQEVPYSPPQGPIPRSTLSRSFIHRMDLGAAHTSFTQLQSTASGDPRPTCTGSNRRTPPSLWETTRAPTQPSRTRSRKPIAGICSKNILTTSPMTNRSRPGP